MKRIASFAALLALVACLCASGAALAADKQDYASMTTPQLQEAMRVEKQAYKSVRKQVRRLVNGKMDKKSPEYKARLDSLTKEAEDRKVALDSMKEALIDRKKAGAGN
ncbi:hypothetical protein [Fundidesulfovibrio terrae]|uniref:hypothetical protein n=1 Tax=Fundidesulfovibrio terrae TaxID=2922866 RepID=UPI001FAFB94E|nr:hypothetical protein [Fundidesulfovibrio terrae]